MMGNPTADYESSAEQRQEDEFLQRLVAISQAEREALVERLLGRGVCRRLGIYRLPADFVLSVIVPVFNETHTVAKVIQRVHATGLPCEIIVVDDGSTDGTQERLKQLENQKTFRLVTHEQNFGKGAAVKTALQHVTGNAVIIQDADTEYDPDDFQVLLQPILENTADVVYGSRLTSVSRQVAPLWHVATNKLITWLFNVVHGGSFTDVETCYKLFRREVIQELAPTLCEQRFGIELEITAKLLRKPSVRFSERPISYIRRTYAEGKKIGWRDGLRALWCILRY